MLLHNVDINIFSLDVFIVINDRLVNSVTLHNKLIQALRNIKKNNLSFQKGFDVGR